MVEGEDAREGSDLSGASRRLSGTLNNESILACFPTDSIGRIRKDVSLSLSIRGPGDDSVRERLDDCEGVEDLASEGVVTLRRWTDRSLLRKDVFTRPFLVTEGKESEERRIGEVDSGVNTHRRRGV